MKPGQLSRADLLAALAEGNQQIGNRIAEELGLTESEVIERIQAEVLKLYGIELHTEVNVV